ncbi:MAG: hypothetical protein OEV49_00230 [candidate division Zixibacteria bacterium]|nr:hypothetical protein [candidate division Zixibacteria bacterium]
MRHSSKTEKTDIVYVKDLQPSRGFYGSLPETEILHSEPGVFIQLEISGHVLRIVEARDSWGRRPGPAIVFITVASIAHWTSLLRKVNIKYTVHSQSSRDHLVEIMDPDRNTIIFAEAPNAVHHKNS